MTGANEKTLRSKLKIDELCNKVKWFLNNKLVKGIKPACKIVGISPTTYRRWITRGCKPTSRRNFIRDQKIVTIIKDYYGNNKIIKSANSMKKTLLLKYKIIVSCRKLREILRKNDFYCDFLRVKVRNKGIVKDTHTKYIPFYIIKKDYSTNMLLQKVGLDRTFMNVMIGKDKKSFCL